MNGPSREEFLSSIARIAESVYDFHERFKESSLIVAPHAQDHLTTLRNRLPLLVEELGEHAQDLNKGNVHDAAAEIADVAFIAIGTILSLEEIGIGASLDVAKKNDSKTHSTHMIEKSSGKLIRKS